MVLRDRPRSRRSAIAGLATNARTVVAMSTPRFVLHYAPRSRAFRILWLLEEARVPYDLVVYDLQKGTHMHSAYLALNPDVKVPVLLDR